MAMNNNGIKCIKMKMKNVYLVLVLIISYIDLTTCVLPQLNVPEEWVFNIQTNSTNPTTSRRLEMTCSGDKPLQWSTEVHETYVKYNNTKKGSIYFSTLIIDEPMREDTGYFNCSYMGDASGVSKSTYVYVNDGISGFVIDYPNLTIVRVAIGDPILLDCRTTTPDIKVSVYKDGKEIPRNEYKFDPRVGVILKGLNYFRKELNCSTNYSNHIKSFGVAIKIQKKLQKPSIENHRNSYYVVGEEFSLNCSIPVDKKDNSSFKWELPNPFANKETIFFEDKNYTISTLKIKNPSLSDSGNYTCKVEQGDSSVSDIKNIEVKKSIVPFVQFLVSKVAMHHVLFLKEGENFHWMMYFQGYPKNLRPIFYDPYRNPLQQKDKRVSTNYVYEDGKLSLSIKRVTAKDFGNYSVRLEAPNGSYDENYAILVVNATPKIEFGFIPSLLPVDKDISITAFILSFSLRKSQPFKNVTWWLYSDCPEGFESCDHTNGSILPHKFERDIGPPNRYKSVVSFRPSTSGELVCQVANDIGINDTQIYLNVSDKTAPFLVTVRTEYGFVNLTHHETSKTIKVIEGDSISIECSALDFLFDKLTFNYSADNYPCDTYLSSAWCLDIVNISLTDGRNYDCVAQNRATNKVETISFRISVVEKMAPRVLPSSNVSIEGTTISVKSSDSFFIACYVEGRPTPKITWLKDDVNIYEIPEYLENKDRVFLRDDNQILEFKFAQMEYEGVYECSIKNRVGHIQPFTRVIVEERCDSKFLRLQFPKVHHLLLFLFGCR